MKIAGIEFRERPLFLAPMEDVTDQSFRLICKELGADMTYSEFVSADALIRNIAATTRKLHIEPAERPTAIQIYGRETAPMVEAARMVEQAGKWPAREPAPECSATSRKCLRLPAKW